MRDASMEQALSRAAADVLEKMFFTELAGESDEVAGSGPQIVVRVPFQGARRGALILRIASPAARTLAGDFLGREAGSATSDEQVEEVVRELANMICGDTLSQVERSGLKLGAPRVLKDTAWTVPAGATRRSFDLGQGLLTVAIALEGASDG